MKYDTAVPLTSKENLDFEIAKLTLLPNEFSIRDLSETTITFAGKGMNSTNQPAVRGATFINIEYTMGALRLNAKLGGVFFMAIFTLLLPISLMICIPLFVGSPINYPIIIIWLCISPVVIYWLRYRTVKALDELLESVICDNNAT